ncbi:MAG: PDZ domain-containing protein [Nitriliruptoraceae bacterium]
MAGAGVTARRLLLVSLFVLVGLSLAVLARGLVPCEVLAAQPECQVAVQPGPVEDTLDLISVTGADVFPPSQGSLHLTTVAVQEDLGFAGWIGARTDRSVEVVPRDRIFPPGFDRDEVADLNAAAMRDSQLVATIVALEALGYELEPDGALVVAVQDDAVTDQLEVDDVITAIDGEGVRESTEVVEAVRARSVGTQVELEVRGAGGVRTIEVVLGPNPDDPDVPYIGVLLTTEVDLPVDIEVDAGAIGGPSAGLFFALSLLELLEAEDLIDGRVIAGTGTLGRDGAVGGVGGVPQKIAGASAPRDGSPPAEVFLVPRDNLDDARSAAVAADVLVIPVDTLEDALVALEDLRAGREPTDSLLLAGP